MDDVAVDAKRILLRYGAPINVLDDVSEVERIELARLIAKTHLPERERISARCSPTGATWSPLR